MYPRLFTIPTSFSLFGWQPGDLTLHTYGLLLAIAFLAGLYVAANQAKRAGLDANKVTDMAVWVLIAGLVGAKLMLLAVDWNHYSQHPRDLLSLFQSGGVFYGGLLGGVIVAWWYARRHSLPGWATADVLAPGLILGQAIGRLGCFAAGCCYGKPANVPWAVTFTDSYANRHVGTPMDTPLHPSQLYESLACFIIFAILVTIAPRKRFTGQVVLLYATLYSVTRFVLEFFRGDADRGFVFGVLSTSQAIAIVVVVAAAFLFLRRRRRERPATPAPVAA
jgi:phosphatidylglycerol:prolipoprotein diacylglycerol transferase